MRYTEMNSPIGTIIVAADDAGLRHILFGDGEPAEHPDPSWERDDRALRSAVGQLESYFAGELEDFDLPLAPAGTAFQRAVWQALAEIPYGVTVSYGAIAKRVGRPSASRAVGAANGRNPLPIVLPCHRVIGADGSLTGYGGGLHIKKTLLALEHALDEAPGEQADLFPGARRR